MCRPGWKDARGRTKRLPQRGGHKAVKPDTLIPTPHLSTKPGQAHNAVEGFFAKLTKQRLKRGVFVSVVICKQPSIASSLNTTPNQNLLLGLPIPTKLSELSDVGTKC